jgi:hypothetical protein
MELVRACVLSVLLLLLPRGPSSMQGLLWQSNSLLFTTKLIILM